VTEPDRECIAWIDANLPPEKGQVGLAARAIRTAYHKEEKRLESLTSGVGVALYSRHYNYRFVLSALEGADGWEDYARHVQDRLDAAWCLDHGIRWFYVPEAARLINPGLDEAIKTGTLSPCRQGITGAVYEVVK
jgi:hypothetical protein